MVLTNYIYNLAKEPIKLYDTAEGEIFVTERSCNKIVRNEDDSIIKNVYYDRVVRYRTSVWVNKNSVYFKLYPTVRYMKTIYFTIKWLLNDKDCIVLDETSTSWNISQISEIDRQVQMFGEVPITAEQYNYIQTKLDENSKLYIECYIRR